MGIFQSNSSIRASDTYLSDSFNKRSLFKKNDMFSVQYIDSNSNVYKITQKTELYNLILPYFNSLADIKRAGIVKEFYRNDTNFKYSAQDFNLKNALLLLEENQSKLNIVITKIDFNNRNVYSIDLKTLGITENEEIEILKKENKVLKRNLNLSNEYMLQARKQSAILFAELVSKTTSLKESRQKDIEENIEDEEEI